MFSKINSNSFLKILKKSSSGSSSELPVLVCDFGKSKIIFLEVEKNSQGLKINKFQKAARPPEMDKEPVVLKQMFDSGGYSTTQKVRISMKGQGVILRFIQFPQMKLAELRSALSFEIDQYIPFKSHEVVWDVQILEENIQSTAGNKMNVLLIAVKKDDLYAMVLTFQKAGLQIELIDIDALACINALEYFNPEEFKSPVGFLDIGMEISTLCIAQNGKPRFIRDISFGGFDVLKRLKRKLGLTHEQAIELIESDVAPVPETAVILKEGLTDLIADLKLSLNYFLDQVPSAETIKALYIAGGGGYHPLIKETLQADLGFKVESMNILEKIEIAAGVDVETLKKNQTMLAIAFGLALRNL